MNKSISITLITFGAIGLAGMFIGYEIVHIPRRVELVAIFALAIFYPVLRYPYVGVYTIFIISPFIPFLRKLYYLVEKRPGFDPLIALGDIVLAVLFIGLFFELRERRDKDREIAGFRMMIIFYFSYMILRTFIFNDLPSSDAIAKFRYYGPAVLLFFIGNIFAFSTDHLRRIWTITIALAILSALYGFKQLYFGYSEAEQIWFSSIKFTTLFIEGIARPFSFFQAPAAFADFCQLGIIGVIMSVAWKKRTFSIPGLMIIGLLVSAILVTSVRSNWIGVALTFFFWYIFLSVKGTRARIGILTALVISFFLFNSVSDFFDKNVASVVQTPVQSSSGQSSIDMLVTQRAGAISNPFEEHSFLSRVNLWTYLVVLSKDPVLAIMGRGIGTLNADSLYFTYLAELGYPGMIFIIWLIVAFISKGIKAIDATTDLENKILLRGIVVMNLVFAMISITGTHIHTYPGDAYFWFWNGVLVKLCATPQTINALSNKMSSTELAGSTSA